MLSELWRGKTLRNEYIKNVRQYYKSYKYIFPSKSLELLEKKLEGEFERKGNKLFDIISRYRIGKTNTINFIDQLKQELGRISKEIPVTGEELSILFGRDSSYIKNKLMILTRIDDPVYNPNYLFSHENLNGLLKNIRALFGQKSKKLEIYVEKYINLNPDIKDYSLQQYTIKNPNYFSQIDQLKPEKFYWLGFLFADGRLEEKIHKIQFKLSIKDKERVIKFAKVIGFPLERIHEVSEIKEYNGEIKVFTSLRVWFGCKPMAENLKQLGFLIFKEGTKGLPDVIKSLIMKAKQISKNKKISWYKSAEGKCVLSFLLGFYDGDGTYTEKMSARIFNTNKKFLEEVKNFYGIKNVIRKANKPKEDHKQNYYLTLGPILFKAMLESYKYSMIRKRNPNI
ncbi:MAG: LAGLIDADG family homing endonuclease [Promethearchaeota archaeon]